MKKIIFLTGLVLLLGIVFVLYRAPSKTTERGYESGSQYIGEKYDYTDIVTVKWGSGSGEIGKKVHKDGSFTIGIPTNIEVDSERQRIYLSDIVNNKIEVLNYSGKHLLSFPVDIVPDIMKLDANGYIYIHISDTSGTKIRRYNFSGKCINRYNFAPEVFDKYEYTSLSEIKGSKMILQSNIAGKRWDVDIESGIIKSGIRGGDGYYVSYKDLNLRDRRAKIMEDLGDKYIVMIEDERGGILNKFPLIAGEHNPSVLGFDKNSSVYVLQQDIVPTLGQVRLIVTKYNKYGKLAATINLRSDYERTGLGGTFHNLLDVNYEGLIFQMINKDDGLHVLKWELVK